MQHNASAVFLPLVASTLIKSIIKQSRRPQFLDMKN